MSEPTETQLRQAMGVLYGFTDEDPPRTDAFVMGQLCRIAAALAEAEERGEQRERRAIHDAAVEQAARWRSARRSGLPGYNSAGDLVAVIAARGPMKALDAEPEGGVS